MERTKAGKECDPAETLDAIDASFPRDPHRPHCDVIVSTSIFWYWFLSYTLLLGLHLDSMYFIVYFYYSFGLTGFTLFIRDDYCVTFGLDYICDWKSVAIIFCNLYLF